LVIVVIVELIITPCHGGASKVTVTRILLVLAKIVLDVVRVAHIIRHIDRR